MSDFYNIITEILKDTKNESLIDTISLILEDYRNNKTFANICLEKSHETRYNEGSQDDSDNEEPRNTFDNRSVHFNARTIIYNLIVCLV